MHEYSGSVCKSKLLCRKSNEVNTHFAKYELDKDQFANYSVHTGLILDSQDSSSFKTIAPLSVLETTAPSSVSVSELSASYVCQTRYSSTSVE